MEPRVSKPTPFAGNGSVKSWTVQMDNYVRDIDQSIALNIALVYMSAETPTSPALYTKTVKKEMWLRGGKGFEKL